MPTIELHHLEGLTADTKTQLRRARGQGIERKCNGTAGHGHRSDAGCEGIRILGWFKITDGKTTRQVVWNDITEVRP